MFEIADRLLSRVDAGHRVVVATVVSVAGSSPSTVGTSMAVDDAGTALGSIAGGCVEGAVYELCRSVLDGGPATSQEFGISDADAFAVGLTCGGVLRVHAREVAADDVAALRRAVAGSEAVVVTPLSGVAGSEAVAVTPLSGVAGADAVAVTPSSGEVPAAVAGQLAAAAASRAAMGRSGIVRVACDDVPVEAFVEVAAPPARMVVYGAMEFSAALAVAARTVGFHVTVCDPRAVFATPERLPGADDVVVAWPTKHLDGLLLSARDAVCVMAHDDRYDAELVLAALRSGAGYVGAMGSRRTHRARVAALRELGADGAELARLRSPIGLDIGAATPQETAVAVVAEVLAVRTGASGRSLADGDGPIHPTAG